ncbi:MAG TPA: tetratricopeptide repeat protein [Candidatus Limnocylindrales bacterium]|nr:tetratricopeptide repeat protein [Candidatus Limnocylindrales bacterium]
MTASDHYYAGLDLFGAEQFDEAIAEFQRALDIDPRLTDALHGLAQAYYAKDDFDNSLATAHRILQFASGDILAWTLLARAYRKKGMALEAEDAATRAQTLRSAPAGHRRRG